MRPGNNNNNRRGRNRGPRKPHSGGMPNKNQNFDGGGSDTRVRGNVYQVLEKYLQLARDAGVAGDRVAAENFLQHADHYYRVITTMSDGQRPRVGGREISVADVNVQNVSQGLSAALYSGGPSQPNMTDTGDGNPSQQGNGNPRNNDGFNANQSNGNSSNSNSGNSNGGSSQGNSSHGNGQGSNAHADDNRGDNRSDNRGDNRNDNRNDNRGRDNNPRVTHGADNNAGDGEGAGDYPQAAPHRSNRGRKNKPGNRNTGSYGNPQGTQPAPVDAGAVPAAAEHVPVITAPAAAVQTNDEQPDYPEHLLPPAATEIAADGARTPRDGAPRDGARAPRGRLRVRRPRAGEGEAEGTPEAPAPVTEGSE